MQARWKAAGDSKDWRKERPLWVTLFAPPFIDEPLHRWYEGKVIAKRFIP
jgi:hypothetical protein